MSISNYIVSRAWIIATLDLKKKKKKQGHVRPYLYELLYLFLYRKIDFRCIFLPPYRIHAISISRKYPIHLIEIFFYYRKRENLLGKPNTFQG